MCQYPPFPKSLKTIRIHSLPSPKGPTCVPQTTPCVQTTYPFWKKWFHTSTSTLIPRNSSDGSSSPKARRSFTYGINYRNTFLDKGFFWNVSSHKQLTSTAGISYATWMDQWPSFHHVSPDRLPTIIVMHSMCHSMLLCCSHVTLHQMF